jgi:hypothetical protein
VRGLRESECWDASGLPRCKHAWRVFVIPVCARVPGERLRRRFDLVDPAREKWTRQMLRR